MTRALSGSLTVLRDAVIVAAIAVSTVQVMRRFVADRYLVPSDSMQPLLFGDPERGDVVLVDKTVAAASRHRGDLVVVEHPDMQGHQLVKRIAASGDDRDAHWIDIQGGDVWLGPSEQLVQPEVKDPLDAHDRFVRWAEVPGTAAASATLDVHCPARGDDWLLTPLAAVLDEARGALRPAARAARERELRGRRLPAGCIGTAKCVDCSYLDADGRRSATGLDVLVTDCSMAFEVRDGDEPSAADDFVLCTIESAADATTFVWQPASGQLRLWRDGDDTAGTVLPTLPVGAHVVEFGQLDGRVWFAIDGRRDTLFTAAHPRVPGRVATLLYVGAVGRARVALGAIGVARDVYAYRDHAATPPGQPREWPKLVPPGHWFLLGDNSFDSRDSRQIGPVSMSSFLGVPRCVLGPWSRRRWLGR